MGIDTLSRRLYQGYYSGSRHPIIERSQALSSQKIRIEVWKPGHALHRGVTLAAGEVRLHGLQILKYLHKIIVYFRTYLAVLLVFLTFPPECYEGFFT